MMMLRLSFATLCASLVLAMPARADYQVQTVVEGLEHPWSLAFLPDGRKRGPQYRLGNAYGHEVQTTCQQQLSCLGNWQGSSHELP